MSLSDKEPSIDFYDASLVKTRLGLSREHLISFGIIVGCDFIPKGVPGIGKEGALKFMSACSKPLHVFNQHNRLLNDNNHCSVCKHSGVDHQVTGCVLCKTHKSCSLNSKLLCSCNEHQRLTLNNHFILYTLEKCTLVEEFPFRDIVKEFIDSGSQSSSSSLNSRSSFRCPNIKQFKAFASLVYMWDEKYCLQQALLNAVVWKLNHESCAFKDQKYECICGEMEPVKIIKARKKNSEDCFEILWSCPEVFRSAFESICDIENEFKTIERASIVSRLFPNLVQTFNDQLNCKKAGKRTKRKNVAGKENVVPVEAADAENGEQPENELLSASMMGLNLESPSKVRKMQSEIDYVTQSQTPQRSCDNKERNVLHNLKRSNCFSPYGEEVPLRRVARITSTPYRSVSPASFFRAMSKNHISSPIQSLSLKANCVPSPYLNVDQVRLRPESNVKHKASSNLFGSMPVSKNLGVIEARDARESVESVKAAAGPASDSQRVNNARKIVAKKNLKAAHKIVLSEDEKSSSEGEDDIVCLEDIPLRERLAMSKKN